MMRRRRPTIEDPPDHEGIRAVRLLKRGCYACMTAVGHDARGQDGLRLGSAQRCAVAANDGAQGFPCKLGPGLPQARQVIGPQLVVNHTPPHPPARGNALGDRHQGDLLLGLVEHRGVELALDNPKPANAQQLIRLIETACPQRLITTMHAHVSGWWQSQAAGPQRAARQEGLEGGGLETEDDGKMMERLLLP